MDSQHYLPDCNLTEPILVTGLNTTGPQLTVGSLSDCISLSGFYQIVALLKLFSLKSLAKLSVANWGGRRGGLPAY